MTHPVAVPAWDLLSTNGYNRLICRPEGADGELCSLAFECRPSPGATVAERAELSGVRVDPVAFADLRQAVKDLLDGPLEPSWYRAWTHHAELGDRSGGCRFSLSFGDTDDLVSGPASVGCRVEIHTPRVSVSAAFVTDPTCLGMFLDGPEARDA